MRILLDTSVILDSLRDRRGRREVLRGLLEEGHELMCGAVNVAEVYSGMQPHEKEATAELIDGLDYVYISREAARDAGEMRLEWQRKGKTLSLPDAIIAAVALRVDLALATDNLPHFPMPRLRLLPLPGS
jgi:predicted nucleic acid-binding protein